MLLPKTERGRLCYINFYFPDTLSDPEPNRFFMHKVSIVQQIRENIVEYYNIVHFFVYPQNLSIYLDVPSGGTALQSVQYNQR